MDDSKKQIALFRYQVIASLLAPQEKRGALKRALTRLAEGSHNHPHHGLIRIGRGTIEEWLYTFKKHGLDGLLPAHRRDRGQARRIDDEVLEKLEELARDRPDLSGVALLAEMEARFGRERAPSLTTLYRALKAKGLDTRGGPVRRDHRAFGFELAGDCWQGDVMHGPSLCMPGGNRRKTYLIAILDDATRLICHAEFYFAENLPSLKDCLKQALLKRGVPRRFYFDNGKIFRSRLVLQIAARLGIHVIHTRPYRPQGRAKLERWFRTVRMSFLKRLDIEGLEDLDALNRLLFAWIEAEYHVRPHRGIGGEAPLDRWMRLSEGIRSLPQDIDLQELFLSETTRRVAKDGTLSMQGRRFEAGVNFIGQKVSVRFDPRDMRRILIIGRGGESAAAFPVDLEGNTRVKRDQEDPKVEPQRSMPLESLDRLAREIESRDEDDDAQGVPA